MRDIYYFILIVLLLAVGVWWLRQSPVQVAPGQSAPNNPVQTSALGVASWKHKGFVIRPLARYEIIGRVLLKQRVSTGASSRISSYDLALGFGPLSDPANYQHFHYSYSGRILYVEVPENRQKIVRGTPLLDELYRKKYSYISNNHLICASAAISDKLDGLRQNQTVRLKGYLVEATDTAGQTATLTSSLSLTDQLCEVIWVEDVEVLP